MGLWLESERMMHPVINTIGVKTQNEVVKEEKRMSFDNRPYGNLINVIFNDLFTKHPYHNMLIGSMEDLDAATLDEFLAFNKKFYVPNNAVLVIAGDIQTDDAKKWVEAYFGDIPKGAPVVREKYEEAPITSQIIDTAYDANIQIPAIIAAYRVPGITSEESTALQLVSSVLSQGASSRMYKKMVDEKKNAVAVVSFNYALEDYGAYLTFAVPNGNIPLNDLLKDMDEEVAKVQTNLISEDEFTKLRNQAENSFVTANDKMLGVAENLAKGYTFFNNTNHINTELEKIKAVTREDIRNVAKKYLNPNQRVVVYYLPKK
jgi:predicted Zn-dependent peptidase